MLIDVDQFQPRLRDALTYLSRNGKERVGDYLEFGVFQGTSMTCMYEVLKEMNLDHVRLFGPVDRYPKRDPAFLRVERLALAPSERAGVAETARALRSMFFTDDKTKPRGAKCYGPSM